MKKTILIYGLALTGALIVFKLIEYSYFSYRISLDAYLGIVAMLFLVAGLLVGNFLRKKQSVATPETTPTSPVTEPAVAPVSTPAPSLDQLEAIGLSQRELEVLSFIAEGYSNQEIAEKLFVSINTIKTHTANIYSKLGVRRRTQAVSKAKELKIIV
ncbi:MAG TPA: helix-turn-helix transcriptional regulator [Microscillaceae bacterium]|nr:helix-turn-helix transcriptional regulator [Microscillaceae bacterium]